MRNLAAGWALLALALAACDPGKANGPSDSHEGPFAEVSALLESSTRPGNDLVAVPLSGVGMIIAVDGELVYRKTFGTLDPARPVTLASASKWLSGATIMALVDEGTISLDDPLALYLPAMDRPDKRAITFRQAMSHTSGFPGTHPAEFKGGLTLQEAAEELAALELVHPPGTTFLYGGVSMHLAGAAAERAAGQPWPEIFRTRIAEPLGLTATAYDEFGGPENPALGGGARASLDDYHRFLSMIEAGGVAPDGTRVLSEAAVETMLANQTGGVPVEGSDGAQVAQYGIGVWRNEVEPQTGDPIRVSSPGLFGTTPWIDFGRGYHAVFVTESISINTSALVQQIRAAIEAELDAR